MEEGKDDEISIDFGKIKKFFTKKKEKIVDKKVDINPAMENKEAEKEEHSADTKLGNADDEIHIDFGKIKNMFNKVKGAAQSNEKQETQTEEKDEGISIDFSRLKNIKNIFKKSESVESDDNDSIDLKKFSYFFAKHKILLLLIIPLFLAIFLRIQPAYLPITDQWATDAVINNLRSQVRGQIDQQYPNLPDQNKNALVENELQKLMQQQKSQIDQQITATSNFFKSRLQDDTGQTYLLAIDPYFWMRHARNILENGHPGDEIRNGVPWDNHMYAPNGRDIPTDMFHAYFEAYLFRFLSFFNKDLNLMGVVFYVPVLISALSVIPTFFITRKLVGNFGALVAAIIVAIHPSLLARTAGGFADTDAYNVMFPLFIAWLFLEAIEAKNTRNSVILSMASGLLVGLYSFTWGGWWYIFDFILISTVFYIAYYAFAHRKEVIGNFIGFTKQKAIKNSITFLAIFFVVSAISVTAIVNFGYFKAFARSPTGFAKLKEVGIATIWPNVFTTVAEQNPASLNNVINQVGLGEFYFFLIALMGIALTLTKKEHKKLWFITGLLVWYVIIFLFRSSPFIQDLNTFLILISIPIVIRILIALWESDTEIDIKYAIFLILWFIATTFASTKGIRFTLLLVPAFAIGFGIAIGELYRYLSLLGERLLQINKVVSKTTIIILLLLLLITPYRSAANTARQEIPSFNDAWAVSLEKIKADSKPDAIINSWWDFGHWFKFWADRAVTFDGTSQNTPQAHWIGKTLLTDDEELAVGILRMLDCSGYVYGSQAFDTLFDLTDDQVDAIRIIYDIMPESREDAKQILKGRFNEEQSERILESTHCEPPEDYFITSEDMIGKSGVWSHFGSWDFDRALIYNTLKKKEFENDANKGVEFLKHRFDFSDRDAENLFYEVQSIITSDQANSWIAPWPGYAGTAGCGNLDEDSIACTVAGIPLIFNLSTNEASAETTGGLLHPRLVSFPKNGGIVLKEYNESLITLQNGRSLGIALVKEGNNYRAVAMDSDLTASMFTRMFYQEGIGLKHFNKFSDERSVFGGRIIVWKVDWEGNIKTAIEEPEPEIREDAVEIVETAEIGDLTNGTISAEKKVNRTENGSITENASLSKEEINATLNISENKT